MCIFDLLATVLPPCHWSGGYKFLSNFEIVLVNSKRNTDESRAMLGASAKSLLSTATSMTPFLKLKPTSFAKVGSSTASFSPPPPPPPHKKKKKKITFF